MRYFIFCFSFFFLQLPAQSGEFALHTNGLIYSDTTMQQLHLIVDSLNLKFKACDLHKIYRSKAQARAHYIRISGDLSKQALTDLKRKTPFEDFTAKYPQAQIRENQLVTKWKDTNYDEEEITLFSEESIEGNYGHSIALEGWKEYEKNRVNQWVYNYQEKSEYSEEYLEAYFFTKKFSQNPLPEKYARMAMYSECMVDTSTQLLLEANTSPFGGIEKGKIEKVLAFMDYVNEKTNRPEYPEFEAGELNREALAIYREKAEKWDRTRFNILDDLQKTEEFRSLLKAALEEALENGSSE